MRHSQSGVCNPQLAQLNKHFEKMLSCGVAANSPMYPQLVMTNLEKVKEKLEKLEVEPLRLSEKSNVSIFFEFWSHLLYICNYGVLNSTMDIVLSLLERCVTLKTFTDIAKFCTSATSSKKEKEVKYIHQIYTDYVICCRETYSLVNSLFEKLAIALLTKHQFDGLTLQSSDDVYFSLSKIVIPKLYESIQDKISALFSALCSVDCSLLLYINQLTNSQIDANMSVLQFDPHASLIDTLKIKFQTELRTPIALILLFPNPFVFIVQFIPKWFKALTDCGVPVEKIIRSSEYFNYKKWFFQTIGVMMRKFDSTKQASSVGECFKALIVVGDITTINELLFITKTNTNIYNTKQLSRMAKVVENVITFFVQKNLASKKKDFFDDTFNFSDLIEIMEIAIASDHLESLLLLIGLVYKILPYFVKSARDTLVLEYLVHKRFSYFFFHWSDLIRNAFYHIILYRTLFVKQSHIISARFTATDLAEYQIRRTSIYDPQAQDLEVSQALDLRMKMLKSIIDSLPKEKHLDEKKMIMAFEEFKIVQKQYEAWQVKRSSNEFDVPEIVCTLDMKSD
ncbi:hypothetical protein EIN_065900 [Entamoeba invadens IP1]|uniref:Uncharacterized protein n=1 Tax=Entamoeba invadens IP1 TaxID=370355 RepID=A0A0A1TXN9_ENTIV|nr:hypothetical protein EIN_065900 [Entamoeba invadens IP1]ELP84305.1 hypothetical protein EIN_065900 [Entamoeba invadens IP1]|eukprot:XP_004183651.1 hypothetical protein EIN_065900 [Entamoeba invadens IP1]